jgi:hypothetical protein
MNRPRLLPLASLLCVLALGLSASPARSADTEETGWPRVLKTSKGRRVTIYEPRVDSFKGQEIEAHAAASIEPADEGGEPIFGAFWFRSEVKMNKKADAVTIEEVVVDKAKFPDTGPGLEENFSSLVERELPKTDEPWPLDRIYLGMDLAKKERAAEGTMNNAPPEIFVSEGPAVLLLIDGNPQLQPISDSKVSRVMNTTQVVLYDEGGKKFYLASNGYWFESKEPLGEYKPISKPPRDVEEAAPDIAMNGEGPRLDKPPNVIPSSKAAELIVFDGKPEFDPVGNLDLLYATNADKDVLKDVESQKYFVLLSGRWFSSKSLDGPWSFVPSNRLPNDFTQIPPGSEMAHVRASVAGTPEAEDQTLSAEVPKIEAVPRDKEAIDVHYDGEPRFQHIKGTRIDYATNTASAVFRVDGAYYACEDGVWYAAPGPDGPWSVSDQRPEGIEALAADNPHYNTKYVVIYDSTPDQVYVGYLPGYYGCYPYYGSVLYGTGYCYPWYGAYYASPWTWGFGVSYWGGWGFGFYGSWGYGYPYYGYPYYGYAYCGTGSYVGRYGPGGYYPVADATTRYRGSVTPSTKTAAGDFGRSVTSSQIGSTRVRSAPDGLSQRSVTSRERILADGGSYRQRAGSYAPRGMTNGMSSIGSRQRGMTDGMSSTGSRQRGMTNGMRDIGSRQRGVLNRQNGNLDPQRGSLNRQRDGGRSVQPNGAYRTPPSGSGSRDRSSYGRRDYGNGRRYNGDGGGQQQRYNGNGGGQQQRYYGNGGGQQQRSYGNGGGQQRYRSGGGSYGGGRSYSGGGRSYGGGGGGRAYGGGGGGYRGGGGGGGGRSGGGGRGR